MTPIQDVVVVVVVVSAAAAAAAAAALCCPVVGTYVPDVTALPALYYAYKEVNWFLDNL